MPDHDRHQRPSPAPPGTRLEGTVLRVTFYNPETSFSVVQVRQRGRREPVVLRGLFRIGADLVFQLVENRLAQRLHVGRRARALPACRKGRGFLAGRGWRLGGFGGVEHGSPSTPTRPLLRVLAAALCLVLGTGYMNGPLPSA